MKMRALVRAPESIERFLRHEGLWSEHARWSLRTTAQI
jgi:hypothetical protein